MSYYYLHNTTTFLAGVKKMFYNLHDYTQEATLLLFQSNNSNVPIFITHYKTFLPLYHYITTIVIMALPMFNCV